MAIPALAQSSSSSSSTQDQQTPSAQSGSTAGQDSSAQQPSSGSSMGSASSQSSTGSMGSGASASSGSTDSTSTQSTIQSALQKDDQLAGQNVNVQVSGKKIMLTGTVASQAQKDHAEQVATQNASGFTVKNKLKVSSSAGSMNSNPKQ